MPVGSFSSAFETGFKAASHPPEEVEKTFASAKSQMEGDSVVKKALKTSALRPRRRLAPKAAGGAPKDGVWGSASAAMSNKEVRESPLFARSHPRSIPAVFAS